MTIKQFDKGADKKEIGINNRPLIIVLSNGKEFRFHEEFGRLEIRSIDGNIIILSQYGNQVAIDIEYS